ncbi:unnamed protein product [Rotaria sordida]|uniref:Uncharacterized protein n=1 Tax=Rotaria sordida TaxID=392033 RepID=A0A818LYS1_9BILA|nr:unnamed protein product [Rotaria sordida]
MILPDTNDYYDKDHEDIIHEQTNQNENVEINELRIQLKVIYKNNEKALSERIEIINHLNEQLHDCQQKIF